MRDYFLAYHSMLEETKQLSDEELGKLFRAMLQFSMGTDTDLDGNASIIFNVYKVRLKEEIEIANAISEKRRLAGSLGGRPKKCCEKANESKKSKCFCETCETVNITQNSLDCPYFLDECTKNSVESGNIQSSDNTLSVDNAENKEKKSNKRKEHINNTNNLSFNNNKEDNIIKDKVIEKEINKEKDKERERFVRPTVEQVRDYCKERNNSVDAEAFVDFYESKGWKVGKTPMKDWKAAVRTWERSRKSNNKYNDVFEKAIKEFEL